MHAIFQDNRTFKGFYHKLALRPSCLCNLYVLCRVAAVKSLPALIYSADYTLADQKVRGNLYFLKMLALYRIQSMVIL